MGLVTVFCPLTMTGAGKLVLQTDCEARFVADCNVNPAALAGHVKMTLAPESRMFSCDSNARLNTVPQSESPPPCAVPYKVLPDKTKPPSGQIPSWLVP